MRLLLVIKSHRETKKATTWITTEPGPETIAKTIAGVVVVFASITAFKSKARRKSETIQRAVVPCDSQHERLVFLVLSRCCRAPLFFRGVIIVVSVG
jgi:hypothetical protein